MTACGGKSGNLIFWVYFDARIGHGAIVGLPEKSGIDMRQRKNMEFILAGGAVRYYISAAEALCCWIFDPIRYNSSRFYRGMSWKKHDR
jgi:hypothetical protein